MKRIFFFLVIIFFIGLDSSSQAFFDLSFKKTNGDTVHTNSYAGKKTMFIILPLNQSDPHFSQLTAFKNRYLDTIRIVGVLSIEDGYQAADTSVIQAMYNSLSIEITEGMYTKKTSGANQSAIMKWLTDKSGNLHFNMDAAGIGHKFFVSETGRLFAVFPPQVSLQQNIIDRVVHSPSSTQ